MTPEELKHFKKQIMNQIVQSKIRIYEFPEPDFEEESQRRDMQKVRHLFTLYLSYIYNAIYFE